MGIKDTVAKLKPKSEVEKALGLFGKATKKIETAIANLTKQLDINEADREWTSDIYKERIDDLQVQATRTYMEWENFDVASNQRSLAINADIERLERAKAQIANIVA